MATYTVVKGDTLWALAKKYGVTVNDLVKWNNITDPNFIVVGQVLDINGAGGSSSSTTALSSRVVIKAFGLQSNTDRTVYATWNWNQANTESYQVRWYYYTSNGIWFIGNDSNEEFQQATYDAPSNALRVKCIVKPISATRTVNDKEVHYWTADWSTEKIYDFSNNPPTIPPTPTVEIDKYKLTASLANLDVNGTQIQFQIVKDDATIFNTGKANIVTSSASYSCTVNAGCRYKVRCRALRGNLSSDWSEYSNNVNTIPSVPTGITQCSAKSETSVYLAWESVPNATTYDIEYTTNKEYFDGSDNTSTVTGIEFNHYEKTGLETGEEYFFRVRAVNSAGSSGWSAISSVRIGKAPAAPTTWSSTTTVTVGEPLNLYWVHNSEDGSSQTYADLELYINGVRETHTIANSTVEDEKDKTSVYAVDTSEFAEGATILWRVRTAGITNTYGDWSVQRTVDVYAPPTLSLSVTDLKNEPVEELTSFPMHVTAIAGPTTQIPISYHLTVLANEAYETTDYAGNFKMVSAGDEVYSKHFNTASSLYVILSASDLNLDNNISYTIKCLVSMNSGLTAENSHEFKVTWDDELYEPNAEVGVDLETLTAYIRPYCESKGGKLVKDILLSVYRRDFDGGFTELATNIDNLSSTFITDPHPALDFARYRIVAMTKSTGAISYFDMPGYPVGEIGVIIQWAEDWSNFDVDSEEPIAEHAWSGSLLRLPYNVDISTNSSKDVSHIEYIGRQHPVSYYGTQLGSSGSWSVEIDKTDTETLYALRRLQNWMGDVYIREPSGSGYWATVTVTFSQTHLELTIPVNIDVVRVEGGA